MSIRTLKRRVLRYLYGKGLVTWRVVQSPKGRNYVTYPKTDRGIEWEKQFRERWDR